MTGPSDSIVSDDDARRAASAVLDHPEPDAVEVLVAGSRTGLTRYARSEIIQNTVRNELRAYVRVVLGQRVASASTNQLDAGHLKKATERAIAAARASRPDPDFPGLPDPDKVGRPQALFRWDDPTAAASAEARARAVADILRVTKDGEAAGVYETSSHVYGIFSSTGIDSYDAYSRCATTCLVETDGATGWGDDSSHAMGEVDVAAVARRARDKATANKGAIDMDPGTYEVVLEPAAVATLIDYASYAGFGAKQVIEGESFLAEKTGQSVAAPAVTVADDVFHPRSVGLGFDLEGVPKQRVAVIDGGTATGPVTDLRTGAKLERESTGHYSGSSEFGPYASNLLVEPGDATHEDLIAGIAEGLLVTRFHYVNILDRPETLLTGMTRDGTFRIRNGEIAEAVHNFRFTQTVLDALGSVQGVGRDLVAFAPDYGSFGSTVAPALHVGEFRFTSRTSH